MEYKESQEGKGIILLRKGQKGIVHAVFSRFGLVLLLLAAQIFFLIGIFQRFKEFLPHILSVVVLLAVVIVVCILNSQMDPTAKITWLIVIMLLPVLGVVLFLYTRSDIGHRVLKKRIDQIVTSSKEDIPQEKIGRAHV